MFEPVQSRLWVKDDALPSQARSRSKGPLSDQVADAPNSRGQCRSWVDSGSSIVAPRTAAHGAEMTAPRPPRQPRARGEGATFGRRNGANTRSPATLRQGRGFCFGAAGNDLAARRGGGCGSRPSRCEGIERWLDRHGASPAFARASSSRQPLCGFLRMTWFLNAINKIPHGEERRRRVSNHARRPCRTRLSFRDQFLHTLLRRDDDRAGVPAAGWKVANGARRRC